MGNWSTLLKISKEISEYENINGVSSVKSHCLLCSTLNLLFNILIIPIICLLVYFVLGFIKSEFSNLVLLSYVLLIIGICMICSSIVYSKTFGLSKLYKLFDSNMSFCIICSNKNGYILKDVFSTWVHSRGREEEFGYVADVVRHYSNPSHSVEIPQTAQTEDEDIDNLFSNTSPKKNVSEDSSNKIEERPNRVMNTEDRPTRPSRPSRASKQNLEDKGNSSDIDDLFK